MPSNEAASQPILVAILSLFGAHHRGDKSDEPALAISGTATETIAPTNFYSFTPDVQSSGSRTLKYTIRNKPAWASFGLRHGTLYGTPKVANMGTYKDITITVSDGKKSVQLPPFSITVGAPAMAANGPG